MATVFLVLFLCCLGIGLWPALGLANSMGAYPPPGAFSYKLVKPAVCVAVASFGMMIVAVIFEW